MKNLFMILTLALTAQQTVPPPAASGMTSITGTVRRFGSGDLLPSVQITLTGPPGRFAISDRQGQFAFKDVPPGTHDVSAQLDGYFLPPKTPAYQRFVITAGQTSVKNVDFELVQGGSVRGRLLKPDGEPLPRVYVQAVHPDYKNGQRSLRQSGSAQTDDRGNYRIFGIDPGDYFVVAIAPRIGLGTPRDNELTKLVKTFFPGAPGEDSAVSVKITSGGESTADFKMLPSPRVTVSGTIIDNVPNTSPAGLFYLVPRDTRTMVDGPEIHTVPNVSQNGPFEIRDVEAGSYYLYATARAKPGAAGTVQNVIGRTLIDVGSQDVAGVTVVIQPNIDMPGRVTLDAPGSPADSATILGRFSMTLRARDMVLSVFYIPTVRVDGTGAFTIAGVPEMTYQIASLYGFPQGGYLADIRQGNKSVLDDGFFKGTMGGPPLDIIVRLNGGTVDGVVRDSGGKVAAAASVSLVPNAARRQNTLLYKRAVTDANGHFNIQGITPGDYKLFAWDLPPAGADEYPDFIMKYEALGKSLSVSAGVSVNVSAVIIP